MSNVFQVKFATYGAPQDGHANAHRAVDVTSRLQKEIDARSGVVTINNDTMGGDPAFGIVKHFSAIVSVNGTEYPFACQEGQMINFYQPGNLDARRLVEATRNIVR